MLYVKNPIWTERKQLLLFFRINSKDENKQTKCGGGGASNLNFFGVVEMTIKKHPHTHVESQKRDCGYLENAILKNFSLRAAIFSASCVMKEKYSLFFL